MPPPNSVFSSHERAALKDRWGSQATRLTRDSFLPFGSCQLCLLPSVDPVCCSHGDLFCRECAVTNLLAQRKEIKRLEKEAERQTLEEEDAKVREDEEARLRAVEDFETVQMGLSVKAGSGSKIVGREKGKIVVEQDEEAQNGSTGTPKKRKFEIDEDELRRIALSERNKARRTLDAEKLAAKGHLPSFWVPGEISEHHIHAEKAKRNPTCPASAPTAPHTFSLKTLTSVHFNEEPSTDGSKNTVRTCPSCKKALSNAAKAVLAVPCGHVLCKPCVDKFLRPEHRHHRDAHEDGPEPESVHCYVCDADLSTTETAKGRDGGKEKEFKKKKKKDKEEGVKPGLVEIRSEGTGYASGGKAVVKRDGVAFSV